MFICLDGVGVLPLTKPACLLTVSLLPKAMHRDNEEQNHDDAVLYDKDMKCDSYHLIDSCHTGLANVRRA